VRKMHGGKSLTYSPASDSCSEWTRQCYSESSISREEKKGGRGEVYAVVKTCLTSCHGASVIYFYLFLLFFFLLFKRVAVVVF
jgi:hypothetical protein